VTQASAADPAYAYCDRCGGPLTGAEHSSCRQARVLEPPRFCPQCRRRMVVQVTPAGWQARCSEHGTSGSAELGHAD
jgi:putative hemolysin